MADPSTLTISIDRTSLELGALVLTGHADPTRAMSVSGYREPAMQARITYAPTGDSHGDLPLGWSYQESLLGFNVFAELEDTEAEARVKIAELVAALGRLSYEVTVTVGDADPETWTCRPGNVAAADDRTSTDLQSHHPIWAVTIPVYPIRSA